MYLLSLSARHKLSIIVMKPLTGGGWVVLTPTQAIILVMKYLNGMNLVEAQWHDLNNMSFKAAQV